MKCLIGIAIAVALLTGLASAEEWTILFDGKSLEAFENPYEWGDVGIEDGVICLTDSRKFFLCTKDEYSNFVFEAEVLLPEGRANSGFQFRSKKSKNRVVGYQAEDEKVTLELS